MTECFSFVFLTRQGNVFTPVCDSVHRVGCLCPWEVSLSRVSLSGGSLSRGGGSLSRRGGLCPGESLSVTPLVLLRAAGMHSTGMHSCYVLLSFSEKKSLQYWC